MRRGELVTVANCGHNVHSQNTVGFLEAVTPFLERQAALINPLLPDIERAGFPSYWWVIDQCEWTWSETPA